MSKVPTLKKKITLMSRINAHLEKVSNWPWKPGQEHRIKPSDLSSPCMRKIVYSTTRTEPDQKIDAKQKRIFDTGDAFHDMVKDWAKASKLLIEYKDPETGKVPIDKWSKKPNSEFPVVVTELGIKSGKIDAILLIDGKLWVGEFKSIKDERFHELEGAKDDHQMQANTYVHLFEHCWERGDYDHIAELEGHEEIQGVIFLYVNKNDSEIKEYVVEKSDEAFEKIVEKIAKVKEYIEKKKLPPKTQDFCSYCSWNKKCARNENPLAEDESK